MLLSRNLLDGEPRWFRGNEALPADFTLSELLSRRRAEIFAQLDPSEETPVNAKNLLAPIEAQQEVWAAGVTYLRSRDEREAESTVADVYARVYDAARPELFFKSIGWRVVAYGQPIRIRGDSAWNVPEPELTLVVNRFREIVGYTAGNDVSSRSIEGENPLYLPQAKTYDGSCALGGVIVIAEPDEIRDLTIRCIICRGEEFVFQGEVKGSQMKRSYEDLVEHLFRETSFPNGVLLMTGTGIVPGPEFTLREHDIVSIAVGDVPLFNKVAV